MISWKYSTESFNGEEREQIWSQALHRAFLPATRLKDRAGFHGNISTVVSPSGIEFSRVAASAQTLSGACVSQQPCLWLALPVKGAFHLKTGSEDSVDLEAGDILYGPTGRDATLDLPDDFVMLYIRIPQNLLNTRLINLQNLPPVGMLTAKEAVNRIFSGLLHSIVDDLEELTVEHIRPIEIALSEFVISSLAAQSPMGCFDQAGASNFRRICDAIEEQLGDGDLTLQQIAQQLRMSSRYIQKLFQQAGTSFSQYLRTRRLEHCRADLASTAHKNLSISEICFRWGFNDAAHFSRSFRADFGMSPRGFRQSRPEAAAVHAN